MALYTPLSEISQSYNEMVKRDKEAVKYPVRNFPNFYFIVVPDTGLPQFRDRDRAKLYQYEPRSYLKNTCTDGKSIQQMHDIFYSFLQQGLKKNHHQ